MFVHVRLGTQEQIARLPLVHRLHALIMEAVLTKPMVHTFVHVPLDFLALTAKQHHVPLHRVLMVVHVPTTQMALTLVHVLQGTPVLIAK